MTVCYDFEDLPEGAETLSFEWTPGSITSPASVQVTPDEPCETITVPAGAESVSISDNPDNGADKIVIF